MFEPADIVAHDEDDVRLLRLLCVRWTDTERGSRDREGSQQPAMPRSPPLLRGM